MPPLLAPDASGPSPETTTTRLHPLLDPLRALLFGLSGSLGIAFEFLAEPLPIVATRTREVRVGPTHQLLGLLDFLTQLVADVLQLLPEFFTRRPLRNRWEGVHTPLHLCPFLGQ